MAQDDYVIGNDTGLGVRTDINTTFLAAVTKNSGSVAPSITYPGMWWLDTSNGTQSSTVAHVLKIRNDANSFWLDVANIFSDRVETTGVDIPFATTQEAEVAFSLDTVMSPQRTFDFYDFRAATTQEIIDGITGGRHVTPFALREAGIRPFQSVRILGDPDPNNFNFWTNSVGTQPLSQPITDFDMLAIEITNNTGGGRNVYTFPNFRRVPTFTISDQSFVYPEGAGQRIVFTFPDANTFSLDVTAASGVGNIWGLVL